MATTTTTTITTTKTIKTQTKKRTFVLSETSQLKKIKPTEYKNDNYNVNVNNVNKRGDNDDNVNKRGDNDDNVNKRDDDNAVNTDDNTNKRKQDIELSRMLKRMCHIRNSPLHLPDRSIVSNRDVDNHLDVLLEKDKIIYTKSQVLELMEKFKEMLMMDLQYKLDEQYETFVNFVEDNVNGIRNTASYIS
jgi:hypothetical protein